MPSHFSPASPGWLRGSTTLQILPSAVACGKLQKDSKFFKMLQLLRTSSVRSGADEKIRLLLLSRMFGPTRIENADLRNAGFSRIFAGLRRSLARSSHHERFRDQAVFFGFFPGKAAHHSPICKSAAELAKPALHQRRHESIRALFSRSGETALLTPSCRRHPKVHSGGR